MKKALATQLVPHEQTQHCPTHGPYHAHGMQVGTKFIGSRCPACTATQKDRQQHSSTSADQAQQQHRIRQLQSQSGIPRRFLNRTFANYHPTSTVGNNTLKVLQSYADDFETALQEGASLILCGKPGTGKTHLAVAVANQIMTTGRKALYYTVLAALRLVKETWRPGATTSERQTLELLIGADLLILDEIGMQFGSETERLILFEIINGRYEDAKPTILIANLTYNEIGEYLSERIMDRLTEGGGAIIPFGWDSYRSRAHLDPDLKLPAVAPVDWSSK